MTFLPKVYKVGFGPITVEGKGSINIMFVSVGPGYKQIDYRCKKCDIRMYGRADIMLSKNSVIDCIEHGPMYNHVGSRCDYGYYIED